VGGSVVIRVSALTEVDVGRPPRALGAIACPHPAVISTRAVGRRLAYSARRSGVLVVQRRLCEVLLPERVSHSAL